MMQVDRPDGGSASPTRPRADRGWSLDLTASGRLAASLAAVLVAAAIAPVAALASGYDPADDANSMYNTTAYTGATAWWNAGYTGAGVDVALIDTGVSPVQGLATPGKIIYGPDLSLESQSPELKNLDTNGHGTFMAGLIAGKDGDLTEPYAGRPGVGLPGDGSRCPDRVGQGRRRRRWDGRQPGHRRDRLGRPAQGRQRPEHPGHQPVVRDEHARRPPRSTRSRTPPSRPGRPASSSSPPAATTATRAAGARPRPWRTRPWTATSWRSARRTRWEPPPWRTTGCRRSRPGRGAGPRGASTSSPRGCTSRGCASRTASST